MGKEKKYIEKEEKYLAKFPTGFSRHLPDRLITLGNV